MKLPKKTTLTGLALLTAALAGCGTAAATPHTVAPSVLHVTHTVTTKPKPAKTVIVYRTAKPAVPVAAPAPAPAPPVLVNADAVVTQFYQDITDQNYPAAWALGGDNIGGTDYAAWVQGYDTTASVALGTVSDFGSDEVSAELIATQTDGTVKTFNGTYTVTSGVITAADIQQTS